MGVEFVKLKNKKGMEMEISNYGATLISLKVPTLENRQVNVVAGLQSPDAYAQESYQRHNLFLGASIGRYAGRISNGTFVLKDHVYQLDEKDGVHLHGGKQGFDKKTWVFEKVNHRANPFAILSYQSKHMEGNYPGEVDVEVKYQLLETNAVKITYSATTDRPTVLNLTHHSYFNLNGHGSVLNHLLRIHSEKYLIVDPSLLPTGKIAPVKDTRYDYRTMSKIGKQGFAGLDDTFVRSKTLLAASMWSRDSGIYMKIFTNQPAMVVYTPPQFPDLNFAQGASYDNYPAICFETQNFPDAPNKPHFPSSILLPGRRYVNETVFDFSSKPAL